MMSNSKNIETMKITENAFYDMVNFIGSRPSESGGALFGYEEDNVLRCFVPDKDALTTPNSYTMNTPFLNAIIKKKWTDERLSLLAMPHSHPYGNKFLSEPDKAYFKDLLKDIPRLKFYTPIVNTIPDGGLRVFPYVYEKGSLSSKVVSIEIVPDEYKKQNSVLLPNESKETVINRFACFVSSTEKIAIQLDTQKDILLILFSSALFFGFVFTFTLYIIIPLVLHLFIKTIELWN